MAATHPASATAGQSRARIPTRLQHLPRPQSWNDHMGTVVAAHLCARYAASGGAMSTSSLTREGFHLSFAQIVVAIAGALHLLSGATLLLAPRWFYSAIGTFPPFIVTTKAT